MQPLRNTQTKGETTAAQTARLAVLAGTPGLLLTAYAAATSTSLTIRADLALTLMDMLVLATVAIVAGGRNNAGTGRKRQAALAETLANAFAALGMCLSMAVVASIAVQRIAAGGVEPHGQGVVLAMSLNLAYAVVNFWILRRWKARNLAAASALARAQICLFSDKLSSNLLIAASLATAMIWQGTLMARFVDPVAGLLIATMTARWTIPVVRDTVRSLRREHRRARRPVV